MAKQMKVFMFLTVGYFHKRLFLNNVRKKLHALPGYIFCLLKPLYSQNKCSFAKVLSAPTEFLL